MRERQRWGAHGPGGDSSLTLRWAERFGYLVRLVFSAICNNFRLWVHKIVLLRRDVQLLLFVETIALAPAVLAPTHVNMSGRRLYVGRVAPAATRQDLGALQHAITGPIRVCLPWELASQRTCSPRLARLSRYVNWSGVVCPWLTCFASADSLDARLRIPRVRGSQGWCCLPLRSRCTSAD